MYNKKKTGSNYMLSQCDDSFVKFTHFGLHKIKPVEIFRVDWAGPSKAPHLAEELVMAPKKKSHF